MSRAILTHQTLESFFRELLEEAMQSEHLDLEEPSLAYLLKVVADFGAGGGLHEGGKDEPGTPALVWLYEKAQHGDAGQRFDAYRHLGDVSLVVGGFFTPHIERKRSLVGLDYYVNMGAAAYNAASELARQTGFAALLREIAEKFSRVVQMFSFVAERTTLPVARDLSAAYERFLLNPDSPGAQSLLLDIGVAPVFSKASA